MLRWRDGSTFATGRSSYLDADPRHPSETARIHVRVAFDGVSVLALLDTGAAWTMLNAEVATAAGLLDQDDDSPKISISTRIGRIKGSLVRTTTTLVAEDGDSVEFDSTVFVSREWFQQSVIGYSGLLERIRFAIDPGSNSFIFGAF